MALRSVIRKQAEENCPVYKSGVERAKDAWADIIRVDNLRLLEIMEVAYYSFLYYACSLFVGTAINRIFPRRPPNYNAGLAFLEAGLQLVFLGWAGLYIRKIVAFFPSPFWRIKSYCPYVLTELTAVLVLGISLVASQSRLFNKFEIMARKFGLDEFGDFG